MGSKVLAHVAKRPRSRGSGNEKGWEPVMFQADCDPHGDGWCQVRDVDPAECLCLGPTQDGVEYRVSQDGVLEGRRVVGR